MTWLPMAVVNFLKSSCARIRALRPSRLVLPACTAALLACSERMLAAFTLSESAFSRSASNCARVLLLNSARATAGPPMAPWPMLLEDALLLRPCSVRAVTLTSPVTPPSRALRATEAVVVRSVCAMLKAADSVVALLPCPSRVVEALPSTARLSWLWASSDMSSAAMVALSRISTLVSPARRP